MDALPPELKLELLCALPDIPTLCSLLQASSQMYRMFASAQPIVLRHVLQKELPLEVQPDAEAVYSSSTSPRYPSPLVHPAGSGSQQRRILSFEESEIPATLSAALCLSKMHSYVVFFTTGFCTSMLSRNPITLLPDSNYSPPSENEIHRIQRAFYRLEHYRNLSCRENDSNDYETDVDSPSGQIIQFLHSMPPWELEHVAFARDYCYHRIAAPLAQVALHDNIYGVDMVEACEDQGQRKPKFAKVAKVAILSSGLGMVHKLLTLKTYADAKELEDQSVMFKQPYLHEKVTVPAYTYDAGLSIDDVYDETVARYNGWRIAGGRDNDKGPLAAWRSAVFTSNEMLRRRPLQNSIWPFDSVYCIWDHSRLVTWKIL